MKIVLRLLLLTFVIVFFLKNCTSQNESFVVKGPYLGQTAPDSTPQIFAPGIVSTGTYTRDLAITPDGNEIYFCVDIGNHTFMTTLVTKQVDGKWTEPQVAPFARDLRYFNLEPHISPDGKKFYFASNRPSDVSENEENSDIWAMNRDEDKWGEPYNLGSQINTQAPEFFPSVTKDGTLYFTRDDHATGISFIFRSRLVDGNYTEPEKLPEQVNSGRSRFNAFISPDENFIIVPIFGQPDSYGATDYYISFRDKQDNWSEPINLGNRINSKSGLEYSASLSPDGKYMFFMSARPKKESELLHNVSSLAELKNIANMPENGNPDIYWVETKFLEKLRPEGF